MHNFRQTILSVLSVEPYGMKHVGGVTLTATELAFSALGRAVWDETYRRPRSPRTPADLSVLSVEPYGMKRWCAHAVCSFLRVFQCSRSSRMG